MSNDSIVIILAVLNVYGYLRVWIELKDFKTSIIERIAVLETIHKKEIME